MAHDKINIAKGIIVFIAFCGVFGLKYTMITQSSPCITQCNLDNGLNEMGKEECVNNCKLAALPRGKFIILSFIAISAFLLITNLIDNIVIKENPYYIEKIDIFINSIKKRFGNKSFFNKIISSNDDNDLDNSLYIRLFDN